MADKKRRMLAVLAAVMAVCALVSCLLPVGQALGFITDSSGTCVNTFSGEDTTELTTEPTTEPTTKPATEPTTEPTTDGGGGSSGETTLPQEPTTDFEDESPVGPATGAPNITPAVCAAAVSLLCAVLLAAARVRCKTGMPENNNIFEKE